MKTMQPFLCTPITVTALFAVSFVAVGMDESKTDSAPELNGCDLRAPICVEGLDLSRTPTTAELMAAGQLGGSLFPTHELKDKVRTEAANLAFGQAIEEWNKHEYVKGVAMLRKYVAEYPDSPWAAEAALHIGCDASYNGRYTEAEEVFTKLVQDQQGKAHPGAKMLLNKARQRLALLKIEQNNLPEANGMFSLLLRESPDWRQRTYASHWIQRLSRYSGAKQALLNCGAEALAYALEKEGHEAAAAQVRTNMPSTMAGHSLRSLSRIAAANGFELVALRITPADLGLLPLPAILHISTQDSADKGHYWVLDRIQSDQVELFDPQSGRRFHQTAEELAREWAGNVLVFSKGAVLPGKKLDLSEMEAASGGCCGLPAGEDHLGDPGRNGDGPSQCSQGAPRWAVNLITMNVYVTDTPLWYTPPIGPPVRITLSYNSQSAISQNEPFGNKWQFSYGCYLVVDTAGTVTILMPDGRRDVFSPDGAGGYVKPYRVYNTLTKLGANQYELRFPDDTVYAFNIPSGTHSQQPYLVEIRDAHGQKLSFNYDTNVRLTAITDAQGLRTVLNYNGNGRVASAVDPFGRRASFQYDGNQNLTKITDMGGYWSTLSYNADVYLTSVGDARGTYAFNIEPADGVDNGDDPYPSPGGGMFQNYRITITDPLGRAAEYHYNGYSSYSWHVSPRDYVPWSSAQDNTLKKSAKTVYEFEENIGSGRQYEIESIADPEGGQMEFSYNPRTGDRLSMTDAHGHEWTYTYNLMGLVTSETDPKGTRTYYTYAPNNVDLVSMSNALGQVRLTYDAQHDVLSTTDRKTNRTTFGYNVSGQLTAMTNALGIPDEYFYDANQRLTQVLRASQVIRSFTYDATNRVRSYTDASVMTRIFDYNDLDQVTRVTYPDGRFESYAYSTCCPRLLDSQTDRGGRTVTYSYDALKRLVETVNPEGGVTRLAYDANGNMTQLIDPSGNATRFAYDLDNRLVSKSSADGASTSWAYDAAGLLTNRTNARGISTAYTYDENHNLLHQVYSDGTTEVGYSYDALNRVTQVTDGLGLNTFSYDANSRLTSFDGPWAGDTVTYTYDALGRQTNLIVQGGQPTAYEYDALRRLTRLHVGTQTYAYTYAGAGPLVQRLDRPNGSLTTYLYDNMNRLNGVSNRRSSGAVISEFLYAYNGQDLRVSETVSNGVPISFPQGAVVSYGYNALNQSLTSAPPARLYAYDQDGNMTRGYTPAGYVLTAAYDAENHVKSLVYTNASGVVCQTEYAYNGGGQLAQVKTLTNGVLSADRRFVLSGLLALQDRDGRDNSILREYTWKPKARGGIGGCLHLTALGTNYSYLYDGKGNVAGVVKGDQSLAASYGYGAFGELATTAGSLDQPLRFSTKRYDEGNGLSYFGYRFYAPSIGRWMTRDPIGERGGINLYGFVGNDPINRSDPLGLWDWVPIGGGKYTILVTAEEVAAESLRRGEEIDPDSYAWSIYFDLMKQQFQSCAAQISEADLADTFQKIEDTITKVAPGVPPAAATAWDAISSFAAAAAVSLSHLAPFVAAEQQFQDIFDHATGNLQQ